MLKIDKKLSLWIIFILVVILPSFILSYLALRTRTVEEAILEKRLEEVIEKEITYIISLINREFTQIDIELKLIFSNYQGEERVNSLIYRSDLIEIPFLLSAHNSFLWPDENQNMGYQEKRFLTANKNFLQNRESTPVYKNLAFVYKDIIVQDYTDSSPKTSGLKRTKSSPKVDRVIQKMAIDQFEKDDVVRTLVYQQAAIDNKQIAQRRVQIPKGGKGKSAYLMDEYQPEQSQFVAEALYFKEIIDKRQSGFLPRFVEDRLQLLYWFKDTQDHILGCLLNRDRLINRILSNLPDSDILTKERILTILDENGRPLVAPKQETNRDWQKPFMAHEIGATLPHWEVAAYLTNPSGILAQAEGKVLLIMFIVYMLVLTIVMGGMFVLRALYGELRLADQKTTFVTNVSHELKTPLTSIRMFVEMLKEKREPNEQKRQQYLDILLSETERLHRLINNVLDFSSLGQKKKRYRMKNVDIVTLCKDLIEGQYPRLQYDGFTLHFRSDIQHLMIRADEDAIRQVLLNLLSNAEKYSADTKDIEVHIQEFKECALINVKDKGIGIPVGEGKKIFEAFYRVDDSLTARTRGTGLGLTIARQIIRDHKGDIAYIPREQGSTFQIKLPMTKE